ncbi:MAG TPA: phage holin family protein [Candidatus Dormibacteraeota bacterium]|nr:phage holin family protein [Candidatus Dormibacteraeota bacterium]
MRFLLHTVVTAIALAAADYALPGIEFQPMPLGLGDAGDRVAGLLIAAVVLGVLNAIIRPILVMISLPITCVTLGLFVVIINGIIFWLLSLIPITGLVVHDFVQAILGALVVSIVSFVLGLIVPRG